MRARHSWECCLVMGSFNLTDRHPTHPSVKLCSEKWALVSIILLTCAGLSELGSASRGGSCRPAVVLMRMSMDSMFGSQGVAFKFVRISRFQRSCSGLRRKSLHLTMPFTVPMIASSDCSRSPRKMPASYLASRVEGWSSCALRGFHMTCSPNWTICLLDFLPLILSYEVRPSGPILNRLIKQPACSAIHLMIAGYPSCPGRSVIVVAVSKYDFIVLV